MWQFVIGFSAGIYTGTYYDCKPMIKRAIECVKHWKPDERDERDDGKD
jgi:hypothetical protein